MTPPKVVIIIGPTATGKTAIAVKLAKQINGEIISADSRQVFTGMDLGSGKDLEEYGDIPYHLIDVREAGMEFSVSDFQLLALEALDAICQKGRIPIICGGTGHYVKALIEDYQLKSFPTDLEYTLNLEALSRNELYLKLKELGLWETRSWVNDSKRRISRAIEKAEQKSKLKSQPSHFQNNYTHSIFCLVAERQMIKERIKQRLIERLNRGMVEEVKRLIDQGVSHKRLERYGLEYKWISRYLRNDLDRSQLEEKLFVEISRYAKRQMTFVRYMQKNGHQIQYVEDFSELSSAAEGWLKTDSQ